MVCFSLALGTLLALAVEPESASPGRLTVLLADRVIPLDFRACPEWVANPGTKAPLSLDAKGTKEPSVDGIPSAWWIRSADVATLVDMELKPEGLCSKSVCVPIPDRAALIHEEGPGETWVSLSVLARLLRLPVAVDAERSLVAVGEPGGAGGAGNHPLAASEMAPDFTLVDRAGKSVRLSDFRGKKVFLFTWASWCACNRDLVGWQRVYEEMPEGSIEFIAAAQDTEGESVTGPWYDRAGATFRTLIDRDHRVTELYGMVNVPTGVWIDEEGRIVRPPEVAYSKVFRVLGRTVGDDRYAEGLKDWVQRGPDSPYWMSPDAIRSRLTIADTRRPYEAALAARLASYLYQVADEPGAQHWWAVAQRLDPDNWNYHRQAWSFEPKQAMVRWLQKVRELGNRPYYEPVEFPTP